MQRKKSVKRHSHKPQSKSKSSHVSEKRKSTIDASVESESSKDAAPNDGPTPVAVRYEPKAIVQERTEPVTPAVVPEQEEEVARSEGETNADDSESESETQKEKTGEVSDQSSERDFSVVSAFDAGWRAFSSNVGFYAGLFAFWMAISLIGYFAKGPATRFIVWFFQAGLTLGYMKLALDVADGKKPEFKELFSCFGLFHKYILALILYLLRVALGLLLLVIPGIIWAVEYAFYPFSIISDNSGPLDSLKKSGSLTDGVVMKLLLFSLALVVANLLGAMLFLVGLLASMPISAIAAAHVYRQLEKVSH